MFNHELKFAKKKMTVSFHNCRSKKGGTGYEALELITDSIFYFRGHEERLKSKNSEIRTSAQEEIT